MGNRNSSDLEHRLRKDGLIEWYARDGERCCINWMSVHDGLNICVLAIHPQVHLDFAARHTSTLLQDVPLKIHDHEHVRRHRPLRNAGRGHHDSILGNFDANVAVI